MAINENRLLALTFLEQTFAEQFDEQLLSSLEQMINADDGAGEFVEDVIDAALKCLTFAASLARSTPLDIIAAVRDIELTAASST